MPDFHIKSVEVIATGGNIPIIISEPQIAPLRSSLISIPQLSLFADEDLACRRIQVHTGGSIVYDRASATTLGGERVLASSWNASDKSFLRVTAGNVDSQFRGQPCEVELCYHDDKQPTGIGETVLATKQVAASGDTSTFSLDLDSIGASGAPLRRPFGFRNNLVLVMSLGCGKYWARTDPIPLELYWLPNEAPLSPLLKGGVQLQLLRMFVLPGALNHTNSRADWLKTVVGICHGSLEPYTGKASDTTKHWLKYDTHSGKGAGFTGYYGHMQFNVVRWIDTYRTWISKGTRTAVNCYDQAAIVQTALSLGIHFRQIHWEYHQVYGFIEIPAKLVGWGECNNPYFGDDTTRQKVARDDPQRQPFRNHAYLSVTDTPLDKAKYEWYISEMKSATSWDEWRSRLDKLEASGSLPRKLIIDACAGPHYGNETQRQYDGTRDLVQSREWAITDANKNEYVKKSVKGDWKNWAQDHYNGPGVTCPDPKDQPGATTKAQADAVASYKAKISSKTASSAENVVGGKLESLRQIFNNYIEWKRSTAFWSDIVDVPIRPVQVSNESLVYEFKAYYTIKVLGISGPVQDRFVSVQVLVSPTAVIATEQLAQQLVSIVDTSLIDDMDVWTNLPSGIPIVGDSGVRAFVDRNIGVTVTGMEKDIFSEKEKAPGDTLIQKLGKVLGELPSTNQANWKGLL